MHARATFGRRLTCCPCQSRLVPYLFSKASIFLRVSFSVGQSSCLSHKFFGLENSFFADYSFNVLEMNQFKCWVVDGNAIWCIVPYFCRRTLFNFFFI